MSEREEQRFRHMHELRRQQVTQQAWLDTVKNSIRELRKAVVRGEIEMKGIEARISEAERGK